MYEAMNYDVILNRLLSKVSDKMDKREGSIIYDALAPAAIELQLMYIELDNILKEAFVDTASRDYLIKKAAEYGVEPIKAYNAILKGEFTPTALEIAIGSRFSSNTLTYVVTEKLSGGSYKLQCETLGEVGNTYIGNIIPIDYIDGLQTAKLVALLIPGEDEEDTEKLRDRLQSYMSNPPQDGNDAQYLKWANEYPGIGAAKIFPLWKGGNTVKVAITNGQFKPAEATLVAEFQSYIDPGSKGLGNGVAPIGSKVTVTGGTLKSVNITANVVLTTGYIIPEGASEAIAAYLASLVYIKNSVSYMRIGSTLLDCESIADINSLTINSGTSDITLSGDEIPVFANLNLTVVTV